MINDTSWSKDDPQWSLNEDTVNDMKELFLMFDTDQVMDYAVVS